MGHGQNDATTGLSCFCKITLTVNYSCLIIAGVLDETAYTKNAASFNKLTLDKQIFILYLIKVTAVLDEAAFARDAAGINNLTVEKQLYLINWLFFVFTYLLINLLFYLFNKVDGDTDIKKLALHTQS